ncbi:alpha/beta hydrolase fold domain-containing protein [Rubrobacter marinus]|uniref:Alpha/beta hydrolase fold domain-containing protein n=1 Tax=Rubrobacter marinus TaxID=2653852 RepID=A0A6G8Q0H0_9ACTN|nr:alpha/beta hydrolase [Rubrobacter marinus]QIN79956.1 alpha/beta hydrolase fold domain-containing protein [Rubrobacter marinus]
MLYRNSATQEELDAQYNLRAMIPEAATRYEEFCERESRKLRAEMDHRLDVPFGPTLAEHVDVYPAPGGTGAPVLVYVHGGFWVLRTSKEFGFVARGPASRGVATVVTNYALAPSVTMGEMVRQTRAAVVWAYRNAEGFGGDPSRLHVAGHSAGGHLVATLAMTDWEGEYGLPKDLVKSVTAISGLYDLSPFPYTFLQPKLQLSASDVLEYSPILHVPDEAPPLLLPYGERETDGFKRQSEDFYGAWKAKGLDGAILPIPGKDHFGILDGFLDAGSPLLSPILKRMGVR